MVPGDGGDVLAACRELLRSGGGRCTGARLRVLAAIRAHGGHLTAGEIHCLLAAEDGCVNLSTVYRSAERLTELGLLHVVRGLGGELTYGLVGEPHHHALCSGCGRVDEVPHHLLADALLAAGSAIGFRADSLVLNGRCVNCPTSEED
ncbi:Fur family transcriptional regulator [Kitasatospora sp. NPDC004289]